MSDFETLTFDSFQAANATRSIEAFKHLLSDWSLLEWAGAASGEMGEAANLCKKILRKTRGVGGIWAERDPELATLHIQLGKEIGDVLAYLSLLAAAAGLKLGECAGAKFNEVSDAVAWPGVRL